MARNPKLEALLQAQYDLEAAPLNLKAARLEDQRKLFGECLEAYNSQARANGQPEITPYRLTAALLERYKEFKRQRDLEVRRAMNRAYRQ